MSFQTPAKYKKDFPFLKEVDILTLANIQLNLDKEYKNHYEYKTWKSFRAPKYPFLTEAMMIDRLLDFSTPPKEEYPFFH